MLLHPSERVAQIERFLARLPKNLIHDVARPLTERLADVLPKEALLNRGQRPNGVVPEKVASTLKADAANWRRDYEDPIRNLRGFILWSDSAALWNEAIQLVSPCFFVDEDKGLWMIELSLSDSTLAATIERSSVQELVDTCGDRDLGPLAIGKAVMASQFGPAAKSARDRASRLERLLTLVDRSTALDESTWTTHELVSAWQGEPPNAAVVRDIRYHEERRTYLIRVREEGAEPHSTREVVQLEAALEEVNSAGGYIRRKVTIEADRREALAREIFPPDELVVRQEVERVLKLATWDEVNGQVVLPGRTGGPPTIVATSLEDLRRILGDLHYETRRGRSTEPLHEIQKGFGKWIVDRILSEDWPHRVRAMGWKV